MKQKEDRVVRTCSRKQQELTCTVRQSYPKGLGDAVLQAKAFVGGEPFVIMFGDDIMRDEVPLTKQLIEGYEKLMLQISR